jgi:hypothetical protein
MPPVSPADGPVVVTGCVSHTQILHTYARHIAPGWNRRVMVSGTVVRQHGTNSIYSVFYRRVTHLLAVAHSIPVGGLQQHAVHNALALDQYCLAIAVVAVVRPATLARTFA